MPVAKAKKEISSKEFSEWMVYESISPGYPEREGLNAALIAQTIYNMHITKGKPRPLKDFIIKFPGSGDSEKSDKEGWRGLKERLRIWAQTHNKKLKEKEKEKLK